MKNIQAVKIGNVINVSFDGKLHKKICGTPEEANQLFKLVLDAKANPTDEAVKAIRAFLNERLRVAYLTGLENDPDTGEVFLAGFNTPIPDALVEVIKDYHENDYPLEAIINFWKLLMINPDKRVRETLFDFIREHDFALTDKGYMVVYKAVCTKEARDSELAEFVSREYLHVKKDWKCNPNKYVVYRPVNEDGFLITKRETIDGWLDSDERKDIEVIGALGDLFEAIFDGKPTEDVPVFTDKHSQSMTIQLGVPVKMERTECDGDPANECSYGLHVGATKYVESFANGGDTVLVCLVNPANVVAVPAYDRSKMRVSEYYPYAIATYENGKISVIEEAYFENDYADIEVDFIEELVAKVQSNELPLAKTLTAEEESRPMSELMKILETRLVDL